MLYSGIDLHKRSAVIATVDETGKVISEASVPTSRFAVARYFAELPDSTRATVEATSSWYWLRDLLRTRLPEEATLPASLYQEQIELLWNQIRRIEQQLQPRLIPKADIQRLLWIPTLDGEARR